MKLIELIKSNWILVRCYVVFILVMILLFHEFMMNRFSINTFDEVNAKVNDTKERVIEK